MTEESPLFKRAAEGYWLTRFMILRLLGGVYAVAFLAAAKQIVPLIGPFPLIAVYNGTGDPDKAESFGAKAGEATARRLRVESNR